MLTQAEIELALNNIEEFRARVHSITQIFELARSDHKHSAKKLFKVLLKNPEEFERLVDLAGWLAKIQEYFPEYTKEVTALLKWRPSIFRQLIKNDFHHLCFYFPKDIPMFLQITLSNQELFTSLHKTEDLNYHMGRHPDLTVKLVTANSWAFDLFITPDYHPHDKRRCLHERAIEYRSHASELIKHVLRNFEKFKILITNVDYLCLLKISFPQFQNALIRPILTNPQERERLAYSFYDLKKLIVGFPQYEKALMEPALNDPDKFKRLCYHFYFGSLEKIQLHIIAGLFPQYADNLIQRVLKNSDLFNFLFPDDELDRLAGMRESFPQYASIFGKSSVAAARAVLISSSEIRKNTHLLFQARREDQGIGRLPTELLIKIAAMTGNPKTHNEESAEQIASTVQAPSKRLDYAR